MELERTSSDQEAVDLSPHERKLMGNESRGKQGVILALLGLLVTIQIVALVVFFVNLFSFRNFYLIAACEVVLFLTVPYTVLWINTIRRIRRRNTELQLSLLTLLALRVQCGNFSDSFEDRKSFYDRKWIGSLFVRGSILFLAAVAFLTTLSYSEETLIQQVAPAFILVILALVIVSIGSVFQFHKQEALDIDIDESPTACCCCSWCCCKAPAPKAKRCCWGFAAGLYWCLMFLFMLQVYLAVSSTDEHGPPGTLYRVRGRNMHLYCTGDRNKQPLLIFEHGFTGQALDWSWIQPVLSQHTRVCSYDRLGYGWSEESPDPRASIHMIDELDELLAAAGENTTRTMVMGHSMAGFMMRLYHAKHPITNKALVMVDPVDPLDYSRRIDYKNPQPSPYFMALGLINPWGVPRLAIWLRAGTAGLPYLLPSEVQQPYINNILKEKWAVTAIREYQWWADDAARTAATGSLGNLPVLLYVSTKDNGLDNTQLATLSTNLNMTLFATDHFLPFRQDYADVMSADTVRLINNIRAQEGL